MSENSYKKHAIEFSVSMTLYVVVIMFSLSYLASNPEHPLKIWISILPVLPATLATISVVRLVSKFDELQQRIQLMSFTLSFAIVGLSTFTYGFLENVGFPHIPYVWIFPFMIMTWGICTPIVARFYR